MWVDWRGFGRCGGGERTRTMKNSTVTEFLVNICIVLLISSTCIVSGHIKLNVPRVRLPYFDNLSVNFTLEVDTPGCYKWSVSGSDIITIIHTDGNGYEMEDMECSDRAIISTIPRASPCCPANTIVYVEEVNTKETVRCDIIVDKIHSINIVTTTKELHLEEAPSKFSVRGLGGMNNEFSTLEGVALKWWLESHTTETSSVTDPQSIMRFIPFSESMYKAAPAIANLEARRQQGSQVLVEGIKTGSVNVFAKIDDPFYKNIAPAQVRIVVIAHIILDPHEVYVVPGTTFQLKLLQMKHGKLAEIKLPSNIYTFEVQNETVATYDSRRSLVTAQAYGETEIIVTDKNTLEGSSEGQALIARIYVREPKFLGLTILPYRNWALMMGQAYEIFVDIYDFDNQKIFIGDNIQVKTTFEEMFFKVESSSENGTYHVGTPIKGGNARVVAELKHITLTDGTKLTPAAAPRVQADMNIFQRIAINPKETIYPWDQSAHKRHEITFTASGGDGNFAWRSTNSGVVSVGKEGQGRIESLGFANVTAAMAINTNIKGDAKVYVLPPTSMEIVEHLGEAEVGTAILIPLAFYTIRPDDPLKKQVAYSTCRHLPFKVEVEDPSFRYDSKTHYPHAKPACAYLPIMTSKLGSSSVTVTYSTQTEVLQDSVIVSTFMPLKYLEPVTGTTVLAVGSSRQLVFEGGPRRPIVERGSGFFRKLLIENDTVTHASEIKLAHSIRDDLYIYEVTCRELGESLVTLHTGNSKQFNESRPVSRTAEVRVICAEPHQIYFKVETRSGQEGATRCPNDISSAQMVRIPVPNYENTLVSVIVKDEKGRKFDNITSLNIEWSTSRPLVTFARERYIPTDPILINGYITVGKNFQTIIPTNESGNVEVRAEIRGYRGDILRRLNLKYSPIPSNPVSSTQEYSQQLYHTMDLQVVAHLTLSPSDVSLFNHPTSNAVVHIIDGSGHFDVKTEGSSLRVKYHDNNKTIHITPLSYGDSKIIVRDLCLFTHRTSEVNVQVNGVGRIETDVIENLELNYEATVSVSLFDRRGNPLSQEHLSLITFTPTSIGVEILEITPISQDSDGDGRSRIQFVIKGKLSEKFWTSGDFQNNLTLTIVAADSNHRTEIPIELKFGRFLPVPKEMATVPKCEFFVDWGHIFIATPLIVIITLTLAQCVYKYSTQFGNSDPNVTKEHVFITKSDPMHSGTQRTSLGSSFGGGDTSSNWGGSTHRLYSTQDSSYLNSGFRQRSAPRS